MTEFVISFDFHHMCFDLQQLMADCTARGLHSTCAWAAELYHSLCNYMPTFEMVPVNLGMLPLNLPTNIPSDEFANYVLAKSCFDAEEYDRSAYFTEHCTSPIPQFLHFYSIYCSSEKKELDDFVDIAAPIDKIKNTTLNSLRAKMQKAHLESSLDGYSLCLYGMVLKKLKLDKMAMEIFCESISAEPLNWTSWLELTPLIANCGMIYKLDLPNHWIKNFFIAAVYLDLQRNNTAKVIYSEMLEVIFPDSTYLMAQIAIAYHNMRNVEESIACFKNLLKLDPYCLDNMDIYSNLLYVREMRNELSNLAVHLCKTDKYRVETCCVIGNYFSLRVQHEQAVRYFQRALRLNPNYLSAWTLLGHEYMEMKNTSFAIFCYRRAIECQKRDYRAWYGLGQTYEILKMPFYCLYYYKQAQRLRPHDSRMMVALGEAYEKLEKFKEAKKCYWKAHEKGDLDCMALMKLAKIFEKLNEDMQAAAAYTDCVRNVKDNEREELWHALLFLWKYYYKRGDLDKAYQYAEQSLEYPETKEDAKTALKQISARRALLEMPGPSHLLCQVATNQPSDSLSPINLMLTP